ETAALANGELKWPLKWQEMTSDDYMIDFNAILGLQADRSVAYAVCYLRSEAEQHSLRILVGSDDTAKVYLNGKLVHTASVGRGFVQDEDIVPGITLHAGLNVLVFKVVNELHSWQGSIRLTDAMGNPVKGIHVTLDPDGN